MNRVMTVYKYVLVLLFVITVELGAVSVKEQNSITHELATIVSSHLYNLEHENIPLNVTAVIKDNQFVKAVQITENLENKTVYSCYRENNGVFRNKTIPQYIINSSDKVSINSKYNGEIVGNVVIYFSKYVDLVLTDTEREYLKNKKELTVCVKPDMLPYEALEEGKYIGICADYLNLISKKLGVSLKILSSKTNADTLKLLNNKQCDIKAVMMIDKKGMIYKPTKAYIEDYISLSTNIQQPFINNIESYMDKTFVLVTAQQGIVKTVKKQYPKIKIIFAESTDEALKMVADNKVFGFIGKSLASIYYIQKNYQSQLKVMNEFQKADLGIGVVQEDKALLNILNKALDSIDEKENIKIRNNWAITTIEKKPDYTFIWYIVFILFIVTLVFIYKQYLLKKSIKESNELINATMEAIIIHKNGICVNANQSALDMFGFASKEEFNGNNVLSQVAPESLELVKSKISLYDSGQYEAILLKKDGTKFYALLHGRFIHNKTLRLASIIDISTLKEQEQLIAEQSKMLEMGEMIGNIAHQWRQPLSAISTSASGMVIEKEMDILTDDKFNKHISMIMHNTEFLSKTIDTFRDYIKEEREFKEVVLQDRIENAVNIIEATLRNNNIKFINNITNEKPIKILLTTEELSQVIINIINNAKDVLLENKIETPFIKIDLVKKENMVIITIEDNGGGISDDILPKIFNPYFTTKHQSQGVGLGLHMSKEIIEKHLDGKLYVKNTTSGAVFTIELPLLNETNDD